MKSNEINYSWSQLHNIILVVMVVTSLRRYTPCLRLFLNTLEFYAATKKVHLPLSERHTLTQQATQGMARGTILRQYSYCLCIAIELQQWPEVWNILVCCIY